MKANYKTIEFIGNGKTTALKNISEHICPKSVLIKSNAFASITKDLEKLKSSIYYELAIKKLEFMDNQNIWKQQSQKEGVKSFFIKQLNIYHTIEKQVKNLNIVDDEGILHNFGEELMKLPKEFEETLSRLFGNRVIVYFKSTNENIINNLEKRNSEYPEAANNFFRLYDGDKNALNKYIDETREKQLRALEFAKKYGAKIHILDLDEDNYLLKLLLIIKQEENQTYKRLHNSSTFYNRTAPLESYGHWNSAPLFNRWQYHKRVFEILETIGLKEDDEALEIGTAGFQVVKNSDTMDQDKRWDYKGKSQTFTHDIRNIPWPLTKKYKVTIALRVFQHLTPNQREAFLEAKKNTEHLIIVVPREYKNKILENSQGIKLEQFIEWNDGVYPQIFEETAMGDLYYFNFTKNIQVEKNKINFTKNLSELLVKINELKNMNEKYVVYGYGTVGKLIHEILGDKIIGYVDMVDPNNHPSLLKSMQFDKVIISILGRESEVTEYLISNFNLDKKKIILLDINDGEM
ncbi:MAG: hypothetical protein RBS42_04390 [Campylobacterales bacterium]|nr:hypothetical protein [Campylobacterales bacterium]